MNVKELRDLREHYSSERLDSNHLDQDPFKQFSKWFKAAIDSQLPEPNAMILSTVSKDGIPSARTVLLKELENQKFVFFTNYKSRKSKELSTNPHCSLVFLWLELARQVRIEGTARRISEDRSTDYFQSRPRDSQIGAWASPQSNYIDNYRYLEDRFIEFKKKYEGENVLPRPEHWGGWEVTPQVMEFWQGRASRMHDRFEYQKNASGEWDIHRLAP